MQRTQAIQRHTLKWLSLWQPIERESSVLTFSNCLMVSCWNSLLQKYFNDNVGLLNRWKFHIFQNSYNKQFQIIDLTFIHFVFDLGYRWQILMFLFWLFKCGVNFWHCRVSIRPKDGRDGMDMWSAKVITGLSVKPFFRLTAWMTRMDRKKVGHISIVVWHANYLSRVVVKQRKPFLTGFTIDLRMKSWIGW